MLKMIAGGWIMEMMLLLVIVMAYSKPFAEMVGHTHNIPKQPLAPISDHFSASKTHFLGFNVHFGAIHDVALKLLFWPMGPKGPWQGRPGGAIWAKGGKVRVMRPLLLHPTHGVSTPQPANIHFIQSSTSQNQYSRSTMIFSLGESAGGASEKRMELLMHCFFLLPDPGLIYISPVWSFQIHLQDLLDVTLALEDRSMQSDPK